MASQYQQLTPTDIDHFLTHGYLKLTSCFTHAQVDALAANLWVRLGMDPADKTTWHSERLNLPSHTTFDASAFAPKAWAAICDLVGGEGRIADYNREWNDGFIVNFGTPEGEGRDVPGRELTGWHVDGDFFVHYLDSPEQALLVIPLFSPIRPSAGGTMICPAAIPTIANHLYSHPEGVSPGMQSRHADPTFSRPVKLNFFNDVAKAMPDDAFVEVTGDVGDVYLLHPLMLHSASNNSLREVRVITNPPVSLKEPFFSGGRELSVVERKTLQALGRESLEGWRITAQRQRLVPERLKVQAAMREEELKRLEALKGQTTSTTLHSMEAQTAVG